MSRIPAAACCLLIVLQADSGGASQAGSSIGPLLEQLRANTERYRQACRDLMAEERRDLVVYDAAGKVRKRRTILSDLMISRARADGEVVFEYRVVREVDGKPIRGSDRRLERFLELLKKTDTADEELERTFEESTRYDLGYHIGEYTLHVLLPSWNEFFELFTFTAAVREENAGRSLLRVDFVQQKSHPGLWSIHTDLDARQFAGPFMRGSLWLDERSGRVWREHDEIFFRDSKRSETVKLVELDTDFADSRFGTLLPQRLLLRRYHVRAGKQGDTSFPELRITSKLGAFRRFGVEARIETR